MPDIRARPWFTRVAKCFGEQLSATDICSHSKLIGINNPNKLLSCVRDRGTDTARQIIRALYSKEQLVEKSGIEVVSENQRKLIRNFVELQNGTLPDHQFNEAINGVFRQAKLEMRKAQQNAVQIPVQKKKSVNEEQSINDKIRSKKSTSNSRHNLTQISTTTMSNFDDN